MSATVLLYAVATIFLLPYLQVYGASMDYDDLKFCLQLVWAILIITSSPANFACFFLLILGCIMMFFSSEVLQIALAALSLILTDDVMAQLYHYLGLDLALPVLDNGDGLYHRTEQSIYEERYNIAHGIPRVTVQEPPATPWNLENPA